MIVDSIRQLLKYLQGIRFRIVLNSLAGILNVCAGLFFVWVSKQLIDIATRSMEGNMTHYIVLLIATMCSQILLSVLKNRLETETDIYFKNKWRHNLFSHLMISAWNGKESFHSGDAVNRIEEDVRVVAEGICKSVPAVIITSFQFLGAFLFLSKLNTRLAWTLIFIMPLFLVLSKVYVKRMRRFTKEIRNLDSQVQSHIQEKLQYKVLIQTLAQNIPVADKLDAIQSILYNRVMKRANFTVFSRMLIMAGFATGYLIAFLWGIKGIYEGAITFGMMTAFLQLVGQIQRPLVELSQYIPSLAHTITSAERLNELDDLTTEVQGEQEMLDGQVGIRLENISFAYPDGKRQIIEHLSYDFTPGSRTAIVGETGVGKSTLIRLMLALLQPREGKVCLYNSMREREATPLTRCNLIYVPQGNTLLSGTIRDNLLLGNPDATDQELRKVLTTAVADFIYDLPDGLDTLCGERGTGLSEGQAQRLCIARGLLRPGNILLLDEFSSSLDRETERLLMERLISQAEDKTLIFITHREIVAQYCDQTIKLERKDSESSYA
ncbi:ABC transporter ATP-binding protein [Proteiniphilum sp. X52]|uniref:ABC transporter ATP-binding protein n=1 Tax=Proteiniphilum sp. X52 TaxID=2382159 RepID=UPI000F09D202|nr:ABC transporter ATP-binding protein [Proteiniphilum sp. X52]RNC64565.1 ABC transporter ATP-binding protein [Proteiniphilum sp. X52]